MPEQTPDLTTVRTLITSVTELARHLGITPNGIYRWIDVNRIPGKHVINVANFYNVEISDLLPLTGSDKNNQVLTKLKPRETLRVLLDVYRGEKTLAAACEELDCSLISAKLILTHWGDELPTLYTTMEQLAEKRISLETAMQRLNVSKYTLHGLRRKYGYQPGRRTAKPKQPKIPSEALRNEVALTVLSGKMSAVEAAEHFKVGYRSVFRYVEAVTKEKLNAISHWPESFRKAFAEELRQKMPNYVQKWFDFAEKQRLIIKRYPKYPQTPQNWRDLPLKRLLVGVLPGEASVEEIAASRGADASVLAALFTSDLRPLDLTYDELMGLPLPHQMAMGELLLAMLDRKRKLPAHVTSSAA